MLIPFVLLVVTQSTDEELSLKAVETFECLLSDASFQIEFDKDLSGLMEACNPPVLDVDKKFVLSKATAALVTHDRLRTLQPEQQVVTLLANCPVLRFACFFPSTLMAECFRIPIFRDAKCPVCK